MFTESIKHHVCTPACTKGWTAGRKCHCARCGENFSTPANFDKHQDRKGVLTCLPPGSVGLVLNARGLWAAPGESDATERFALSARGLVALPRESDA